MKTIEDLQAHGLRRLDVYVNGKHVAVLAKEGDDHILTYLPSAAPDDYVTISMPVRMKSWVSPGKMFPFFEMNLPEGTRRDLIMQTFGKAMCSEEMGLLAITGYDAIGRVQVVPEGFPLDWRDKCQADDADLDDADAFFTRAVERYAGQGVSGVQSKVLIEGRITLKSGKAIMKHDGDDLPGLSINEYLSMTAARRARLTVPDFRLSRSGKTLLVDRFDGGAAFEDMCSLFALSPNGKYSGSMERMLKVLREVITDGAARTKAAEEIVRAHVLNVCVGNTDAHLKNFGVLTRDGRTTLAPIFDVVTVRAFQDFKRDIPSLMVNGKKELVIGKAFSNFALQAGISPKRLQAIIDDVDHAVRQTMPMIKEMADQYPSFREHAKAMLVTWSNGLQRIRGIKVDQEDDSILKEVGFSDRALFPLKKASPMRADSTMGKPSF